MFSICDKPILDYQNLDRDVLKSLIPEGQLFIYQSPEYVKDMGTPDWYYTVTELLSCLDDEKKVEEALKQHQEWYDELDEESAKAILGIAGVKTNLKRLKKEEGK